MCIVISKGRESLLEGVCIVTWRRVVVSAEGALFLRDVHFT